MQECHTCAARACVHVAVLVLAMCWKAATGDTPPITGLKVTEVGATSVRLEWAASDEVDTYNGTTGYNVQYTYINCSNTSNSEKADIVLFTWREYNESRVGYNVTELQPYWNYTFTVSGFKDSVGNISNSRSKFTTVTTSQAAPGPPMSLVVSNVTHKSLALSWQPPGNCEVNGVITNYTLTYTCLQPDTQQIGPQASNIWSESDDSIQIDDLQPYYDCAFNLSAVTIETGSPSVLHQQTQEWYPGSISRASINISVSENTITLTWSPPENPNGRILVYTVTWLHNSSEENGVTAGHMNVTNTTVTIRDLHFEAEYTLQLAALTSVGIGDWSDEIHVTTHSENDLYFWLLIGGLAALGLIVIAASVTILIVCKRRKKVADPNELYVNYNMVNTTLARESEWEKRSVDRIANRPMPIRVTDFPAYVDKMNENHEFMFDQEFSLLRDLSPRGSCSVAEMPYNLAKNCTHRAILPLDHSRVKLLPTEEEGSDYINANFMPGSTGDHDYIATQSPLANTEDDFWRMVWENRVYLIVMLNSCIEGGRARYKQYWPNEGDFLLYGDLLVQNMSETRRRTHIRRMFRVSQGIKARTVKHIQLTIWQTDYETCTTESAENVLEFIISMQKHMTCPKPIVVHCGTGVGRTGIFICLSHQLDQIKERRKIDIFGAILAMRYYRPNMVQTEDQYMLIYECLKLAIILTTEYVNVTQE